MRIVTLSFASCTCNHQSLRRDGVARAKEVMLKLVFNRLDLLSFGGARKAQKQRNSKSVLQYLKKNMESIKINCFVLFRIW